MRDTYLNQILAFRFGDQRLKLWGGEGVDEPGFRHDEEEYLGAGENGQLICLTQTRQISLDSVTDKIFPKLEAQDATFACATDAPGTDSTSYLLHDSGFALRECDVTTRLVLDELDVDLPPLTTGLIIIVVIIIAGGAETLAFDAAIILRPVAIAGRKSIILHRGRLGRIGDVGHGGDGEKNST